MHPHLRQSPFSTDFIDLLVKIVMIGLDDKSRFYRLIFQCFLQGLYDWNLSPGFFVLVRLLKDQIIMLIQYGCTFDPYYAFCQIYVFPIKCQNFGLPQTGKPEKSRYLNFGSPDGFYKNGNLIWIQKRPIFFYGLGKPNLYFSTCCFRNNGANQPPRIFHSFG